MPTVSWTGFSPTMGANGANVNSLSGTLVDGENPLTKKIAKLMNRQSFRPLRRLMRGLNGSAAGAVTAIENRTQVKASQVLNTPVAQGGLIVLETVPLLGATVAGRVTAAADETRIDAMIDEINAPASYPTDPSGNGGGGKLGR
jgi:hypothetical protein